MQLCYDCVLPAFTKQNKKQKAFLVSFLDAIALISLVFVLFNVEEYVHCIFGM